MEQLLPYLEKRGILQSKIKSFILSQTEREPASNLLKVLNGKLHEPGTVAHVVEGIYLALLDCYEESGNVYCHGMAVNGLRPVGM